MATDNRLGFTCVENQVLLLLKERNQPVESLYFDCAIPLSDLYDDIVTGDVPFYAFRMIERIQDVLKKLGVIEMTLMNLQAAQAETLIGGGSGRYFLVRVKPAFVTGRLHKRSIREDHFVRIEKEGRDYKLTNDIPDMAFTISGEVLNDAYDGQLFSIRYMRDMTEEDIAALHNGRQYRIEDIPDKGSAFGGINRNRIVDLLVVYKILRQRMGEYYKADFIDGYIDSIEKLRMKSQYAVLRNDASGMNEVLNALKAIDTGIWGDFVGKCKGTGHQDNP